MALVRFIAALFIEKQLGRDAMQSELLRRASAILQLRSAMGHFRGLLSWILRILHQFANRGAMVWRLLDHRLGRDVFMGILRGMLQTIRTIPNGLNLPVSTRRVGRA